MPFSCGTVGKGCNKFMGIIVKSFERPDQKFVNEFAGIGVATIHESLGKENTSVMDPSIKPLKEGMKLLGPALTVDCFHGDNLTLHIAMTLSNPGDILVVDAHKSLGAMFGGQMTFQARQQGIGGLVVDGSVRDSEEIRASGFPCFARFVSPIGTAKNTIGSVNVPIQCGGVVVKPGDLVVGDDDGVVVVPRREIREVIEKARKRLEKEAKDREQFKLGKTSMDLNPSFQKVLSESGVKQVKSLEEAV